MIPCSVLKAFLLVIINALNSLGLRHLAGDVHCVMATRRCGTAQLARQAVQGAHSRKHSDRDAGDEKVKHEISANPHC